MSNQETLYRHFVDVVWRHATESTSFPSTKTADMLIETAMQKIDELQHEHPPYHNERSSIRTGWEIADTIRPGVLSDAARSFLAGQIAGAIEKATSEKDETK